MYIDKHKKFEQGPYRTIKVFKICFHTKVYQRKSEDFPSRKGIWWKNIVDVAVLFFGATLYLS